MKRFTLVLFLAAAFGMAFLPESSACTSAIISGRLTPDGRPLLWKHRDTQELNNRVDYISRNKNVKYAFITVVNASREEGETSIGDN